eukprot:gene6231-6870_t
MKSSIVSEVVEATFSIYEDSDRRDGLSVCQITKLESLNEDGTTIRGGLYDSRMGPLEQTQTCGTCKANSVNCPGHPGHIELDVPVYYPMYFGELVKVLRMKCMFCHKLRMSHLRTRYYLLRLMLLEMGDIDGANSLFDLVAPSQLDKGDGITGHSTEENSVDKKLHDIEARFKRFASSKTIRNKPDLLIKSLQRNVIEEFQKLTLATKRCENCSAFSPPIRKDGAAKIFMKAIPLRQRKSMSSTLPNAVKSTPAADKYLPPLEVEAQIKLLWQENGEILNFIWCRSLGKSAREIDLHHAEAYKIFFMRVVLVPPNRFRPMGKVGDRLSEHPQNVHLKKILETNFRIRLLQAEVGTTTGTNGSGPEESVMNTTTTGDGKQVSRFISTWIDLQNAVNCYMDSAKDPNPLGSQNAPIGIRQLLERKEGLFRRHMMGKRVNYCCRSVISPDPYMGSNEIGIPVHFAKNLTYPTPVNSWNVKYLRTLVERGPDQYPGANSMELSDGRIIKLDKLSAMERAGKAKLLLSDPGIKVYRHLVDGDVLLVNRQPTLHKPGIMAHKARVLKHVKEQTLRMNYANCNTYNADFDGDEMNCHFVQSELARAEAYNICNTDNQYIVPTSGNPLRGLIQDHVASAVKLTCKDSFLDRATFQQLVYIAISGLSGTEIISPHDEVRLPPPTIWKPTPLWTGKQVITALLSHLCRPPLPPLNLDSKARTPPTAFGAEQNEHEVIIRQGALLSGVLDKNAIGNVSLGLVHAVYELYGAELAGRLLNAFGRLFTYYLQGAGHSCGLSDLVLTRQADQERRDLLEAVQEETWKGLEAFLALHVQSKGPSESHSHSHGPGHRERLQAAKIARYLTSEGLLNGKSKLDSAMQGIINQSASQVIKACLPNGLQVPFLSNHFSMMVLTGAKGSAVNQSQISCFLGQQALEGMRVPIMISGKTLPSFKPYDGSARAGGFVRDRFLTGVKPQEYYFHCMAGREGLVDTAVKTSRSGYLQRCLMKHLEELAVGYDFTVRDSGGNVIQFLYGEDGLDPVAAGMLGGKANQMLFLARNNQALTFKYSLHDGYFDQGLSYHNAASHHEMIRRAKLSLPLTLDQMDKKMVLLARRKKDPNQEWSRDNLLSGWHAVEVTKVRSHESKHKMSVDIRYLSDHMTEKKVPLQVYTQPTHNLAGETTGNHHQRLALTLFKLALPQDTAQSKLSLGSTVGACSERIQAAIETYAKENPDGVITEQGSLQTVAKDAFELLLWVKFMRSLACPGESVGCVAAQSVGEPSTQMTLNTFHLAGHGGANVTLGIPRLREIIMTASKALKTPTMLIPLVPGRTPEAAKSLARKLSCLPLATLLSHSGGVEVGESLTRSNPLSRWERRYRIRLHFEAVKQIEHSFGVVFDTIVATVKRAFLNKLDYLIKLEQRRAGESTAGKNDALKAFRSAVKPGQENGRKKSSSEDDDDDDDDEGREEVNVDEDVVDATDKDNDDSGHDSDSEASESSDSDNDNDDEDGKALRAPTGYGVNAHEDDSDEEEDTDNNADKDEIEGVDDVEVDDEDMEAISKKASSKKKDPKDSVAKRLSFSLPSSCAVIVDNDNKSLSYNEVEGWVEVVLQYPSSSRRLLMAQLAEKAAGNTMVRATKNIVRAHPIEDANTPGGLAVQSEGVNFEAIWALPETLVNYNAIQCNDINQVLLHYGVEAARLSIVSEIQAVFAVYGIDVNPRHLSLIGDFMTRHGEFTPMNRMGMVKCPSPLLQMSFETTCTFLTKAAQENIPDNMMSPSARIVTGSVCRGGTGAFEVMIPLVGDKTKREEQDKLIDSVVRKNNVSFDFDLHVMDA